MRIRCLGGFSVMWVPKLLLPPVKIRIFGPNIDNPIEIRQSPSPRWFEGHFNESMNFDNPEEFDDPQVVDDPTLVSTESMDFDNPKVYGDTSIFDGLVLFGIIFPRCPKNFI